jgi:hypothetical protein
MREWVGLGIIVVAAVGAPMGWAAATGSLGVPRNDGWAYARIALALAETGSLDLIGWNATNLIGQLLWVQPWLAVFARSVAVLHIATAVTSGAGLGAAFFVARRFLSPRRALLATAVIGVAPGYALMSNSFMTDPTAFAAQLGSLGLALAAFDRVGWRRAVLLGSALALAVLGFTVREVALAAPLAILTGWALETHRRGRSTTQAALRQWAPWALAALAVLAACAVFYAWRVGLPGHNFGVAGFTPGAAVIRAGRGWFTLALILSPALALCPAPRPARLGWLPLLAGAATLVGAVVLALRELRIDAGAPMLTGNSLTRFGALDNVVLLGTKPAVIPAPIWGVVAVAAAVAGAVLAARLVGWLLVKGPLARLRDAGSGAVTAAVFAALALGVVPVYAFAGGALFDRYLWPGAAVAVVGLLAAIPTAKTTQGPARPRVCHTRPSLRAAASTIALAGLTLLAAATTMEAYSYAAARWAAGEQAAAAVPADAVDAGYAWAGFHHDGLVGDPGAPLLSAPPRPFYMVMLRGSSNCVTVAAAPRQDAGLQLLGTRSYQPAPLMSSRSLWLYRNPSACRRAGLAGR